MNGAANTAGATVSRAELRVPFLGQNALALVATAEILADTRTAFFVRKSPGLRIRVVCERETAQIEARLGTLADAHPTEVARPWRVPYYADPAPMGGVVAMEAVLQLACVESRMVLDFAAGQVRGEQDLAPMDISASVIDTFFIALAADAWELWSLWTQLGALRGEGGASTITPAMSAPATPDTRIDKPGAVLCETHDAAARAGQHLLELETGGQMTAPARFVAPIAAAFHLNRMGFDANSQRALAAAMAARCDIHATPIPSTPQICGVVLKREPLAGPEIFNLNALDRTLTEMQQIPTELYEAIAAQARASHGSRRKVLQALLRNLRAGNIPSSTRINAAAQILTPSILRELQCDVERLQSAGPRLTATIADAEIASVARITGGPTVGAIADVNSHVAADLAALRARARADWGKRDRRLAATGLRYAWRHAGRATPFRQFARTVAFATEPDGVLGFNRASGCASADTPFDSDCYAADPTAHLPDAICKALPTLSALFCRPLAGAISPSDQIFAAIVRGLCDAEKRMSLGDLTVAAETWLDWYGPGSPADPVGSLAARLGVNDCGEAAWLDSTLVDRLRRAHGTVILPPPAIDPASPRTRASLRLCVQGNRVILRFLGADKMSLLTRYLPHGFAPAAAARHQAAKWFARWPETVDVSMESTHMLDAHAPITVRAAPYLDTLAGFEILIQKPGRAHLTDALGVPVSACHFGVSHPTSLPLIARLALAAGSQGTSIGQRLLDHVNAAATARIISENRRQVLPEVTVGHSVVLATAMTYLPAGDPIVDIMARGDVAGIVRMVGQDASFSLTLGPTRVTAIGASEPMIVDTRLPAGMKAAAKMTRKSGAMFENMLSCDGRSSFEEYYIEIG